MCAQIFQTAQAIRQSHQRISGHPVEAGRYGHRNRSRQTAHLPRRRHERRRHEEHAGIFHGEAVHQRSRRSLRQRKRSDSRRLRLHQRLSRGKVLSRRKALHHRRRHQRSPAAGDRQAIAERLICVNPRKSRG